MEQNKKFKYQNRFLLILGAIVCIIYGGRDSNYWGLVEKSGKEILTEVGMGKIDPKNIKLNTNQLEEIKELIQANPNEYNDTQKSLVSGKSGTEILTDVGLGKTDPKKIKLNTNQLQEIKKLIESNPNEYNATQKSLIHDKSGEDILYDVGNGFLDPNYVVLTTQQLNEIKALIQIDPNKYNEAQKLLLSKKTE